MISIQIYRNAHGSITGYHIRGHANTAPHGKDIVCAGVAALSQTALLGLDRHLKRRMNVSVDSGNLSAELTDLPDALTDAILESMVLGLQEIAQLYPKSVRLSEHRR